MNRSIVGVEQSRVFRALLNLQIVHKCINIRSDQSQSPLPEKKIACKNSRARVDRTKSQTDRKSGIPTIDDKSRHIIGPYPAKVTRATATHAPKKESVCVCVCEREREGEGKGVNRIDIELSAT